MKRQQTCSLWLAASLGLASATAVLAQTPSQVPGSPAAKVSPAGARLTPTAPVGGQTVQLNGKGTRYRAVVRVYDVGLYTTAKVNSVEQLAALTGPKRLHLITLRDLTGDSLGVAMVKGMQDNAPAGERIKLIAHMDRLSRIFGAEQLAPAGTVLTIDYVPSQGTMFFLNGESKGEIVTDPAYFVAVARIWLGPKPADAALKDALLGIETRRPESAGG